MAHSPETRQAVRASYVYERLDIVSAGAKHGVSAATSHAWKSAAKKEGDDWTKARTASRMVSQGMGDTTNQILEGFCLNFITTNEDLINGDYNGLDKADRIAKLAEAYLKTMSAATKGNPKLAKLAIATEVIFLLSDFIVMNFPDATKTFIPILDSFKVHLNKVLPK